MNKKDLIKLKNDIKEFEKILNRNTILILSYKLTLDILSRKVDDLYEFTKIKR